MVRYGYLEMNKFNYKTPVGPSTLYDYSAALQFSILFNYGLRAYHKFLDFGCGSLRLGRLMIQYLEEHNYYGIEPRKDLINEGIKANHLRELIDRKKPNLRVSDDCNMATFNITFDYILAYSIFTHMPIAQIQDSLKSAYLAMDVNTIFLATYFEGKVDNELKNWTPTGIYYRRDTISHLIQENNLLFTQLNLTGSGGQCWLLVGRTS